VPGGRLSCKAIRRLSKKRWRQNWIGAAVLIGNDLSEPGNVLIVPTYMTGECLRIAATRPVPEIRGTILPDKRFWSIFEETLAGRRHVWVVFTPVFVGVAPDVLKSYFERRHLPFEEHPFGHGATEVCVYRVANPACL